MKNLLRNALLFLSMATMALSPIAILEMEEQTKEEYLVKQEIKNDTITLTPNSSGKIRYDDVPIYFENSSYLTKEKRIEYWQSKSNPWDIKLKDPVDSTNYEHNYFYIETFDKDDYTTADVDIVLGWETNDKDLKLTLTEITEIEVPDEFDPDFNMRESVLKINLHPQEADDIYSAFYRFNNDSISNEFWGESNIVNSNEVVLDFNDFQKGNTATIRNIENGYNTLSLYLQPEWATAYNSINTPIYIKGFTDDNEVSDIYRTNDNLLYKQRNIKSQNPYPPIDKNEESKRSRDRLASKYNVKENLDLYYAPIEYNDRRMPGIALNKNNMTNTTFLDSMNYDDLIEDLINYDDSWEVLFLIEDFIQFINNNKAEFIDLIQFAETVKDKLGMDDSIKPNILLGIFFNKHLNFDPVKVKEILLDNFKSSSYYTDIHKDDIESTPTWVFNYMVGVKSDLLIKNGELQLAFSLEFDNSIGWTIIKGVMDDYISQFGNYFDDYNLAEEFTEYIKELNFDIEMEQSLYTQTYMPIDTNNNDRYNNRDIYVNNNILINSDGVEKIKFLSIPEILFITLFTLSILLLILTIFIFIRSISKENNQIIVKGVSHE